MVTHSSILAWEIPRTEEPGGYSPGVAEESDVTVTKQQGQLPQMGFQGGTVVKNPPVNAGDTGDTG